MVLTPSIMAELGTPAAPFKLKDPATGRFVSLDDFKDIPVLLVMFICNHCPYVKHLRAGLAQLGRDYAPPNFALVAINSNDAKGYPADNPENMIIESKTVGYTFPYLFDETQEVAKKYQATCTPDFFLFDSSRRLVYRGQFDGSRPGNQIPVTGKDLRNALDRTLAGHPLDEPQKASVGCNIKWRP